MAKKNKEIKEKYEPLFISDDYIEYEQLTKSQKEADCIFRKWFYAENKKPVLRIGGEGGTGKSFLIQYIIQSYHLDLRTCMVMSYTGQAVNVLRRNAIMAKTIHSSIMVPIEEPLIKDNEIITKHGIPVTTTRFRPIKSIPSSVQLIIIDESSFLPESLEKILKRYNIPILEIGDPIQLPPVAGEQCFRMDNLDYFMEGVVRQKGTSEILKLATHIRKHEKIDTSEFTNDVLFIRAQPTIEETFLRFKPFFKASDVIITSTNKQRQIVNDMYRKYIIGTEDPYPKRGEHLICRRNDWSLMLGPYPLTNGTQGICTSVVGKSMIDKKSHIFYMDFQPDFIDNDYYDNLMCDSDFLMAPPGSDKEFNKYNSGKKFEFSYAITAHLSQGGEYNTVLFMDAFNHDRDYQMRVRYTATTRAKQLLIYVIPYFSKAPGWFDLRK